MPIRIRERETERDFRLDGLQSKKESEPTIRHTAYGLHYHIKLATYSIPSAMETAETNSLVHRISKILDDCRTSNATHLRKLKDLLKLRSSASSSQHFFTAFSTALTPLFDFQRRIASADRIVRFVSVFSTARDSHSDAFLPLFLHFLLLASSAANKTARFRSCQIISEIIIRLPDDAEVSSQLWDEVIGFLKLRVGDKVPQIRSCAIRALSRFANDAENSDVLELFLEALSLEQNADVRKTIVLSLPPTNVTSAAIIDCILDVSEAVRRAAFCALADKFPLPYLSIKMRTTILQRGLGDRSVAVTKECLKLLKDKWFLKCCNGDPIELLQYLDVETYELVGESVMAALLKGGLVKVQDGQSIRKFIVSSHDTDEVSGDPGLNSSSIKLMTAEVALYWKAVSRHLQMEAQEKGSDAASTMGTEAAVYAAEASDSNDLLEKVLPATVSDYVILVKSHLVAGPNYHFASRQLLLLGEMLDFSDSMNRRVASAFIKELLHRSLDHEVEDNGNKVVIGDGISLGGDMQWADAVSGLARKVHAASGEFEEVVLGVVEELAQPCRERTADFLQWMHCLAVVGLLLENVPSFSCLQGKAIEPVELLHSLLLPAAKHLHLDVQRVAIRCLGLFGLLEGKPIAELVQQLRISFIRGPLPISIVACKALLDNAMWHSPKEVDRAMGEEVLSKLQDDKLDFCPVNLREMDEDPSVELLDLLYSGFNVNDFDGSEDIGEDESIQSVVGEGFAKFLLLSEKYPRIPTTLHPSILVKLISLYFSDHSKSCQRLKQCLSVFFEHYPLLSANHKKCLSKAFIPVMRSMWPGIYGNAGGSSATVSKLRKRAVQASRFMLQMMQAHLYTNENEVGEENGSVESPQATDSTPKCIFESEEEGLALRLAAEVASFHPKKTAAERSYVAALCRILVLIHFRSSEQGAIKLMRRLLNRVVGCVLSEKEIVKELRRMAECLRSADIHPDQKLLTDQAKAILDALDMDINVDDDDSMAIPATPAPETIKRQNRSRRRARQEETSSEEEESPSSDATVNPPNSALSTRSHRASKTAALNKMSALGAVAISEEEDEISDLTSEDSESDN